MELATGLNGSRACAVFVGEHDLGAWEREEIDIALDRAATQPGFRVFSVLLPGLEDPVDPPPARLFAGAHDFRRGRDDGRALQDLINAIKGVPFGPDVPVPPSDDIVPYRGLWREHQPSGGGNLPRARRGGRNEDKTVGLQ